MFKEFLILQQKIRYKYYQVLTAIKLMLFSKNAGHKNCIIKPILISYNALRISSGVFIRDFGRVEAVTLYQGTVFNPKIILGVNVSIEQNVHITCASRIEILNNTSIAANVTISDIIHNYEDIHTPPDMQPISVDDVQIGESCKLYNNSVILPGVILGRHNIVAANTVVLKGIYPDYCVLVGSPAKIVKRYNFETQEWAKTNHKGEFLN